MAKQTLGQGDSNVVVRNQVVYGALPQDVIDRMGDTTLALQTTEQNVLPAINELKSNLTLKLIAKEIDFSKFYWDSTVVAFRCNKTDFPSGITPLFYNAYCTNGSVAIGFRETTTDIRLVGRASDGTALTSSYTFKVYVVGVES